MVSVGSFVAAKLGATASAATMPRRVSVPMHGKLALPAHRGESQWRAPRDPSEALTNPRNLAPRR
jgi:hypothetical protein